MNRLLLGGVLALAAAGLGMFWWQGRAEVEAGAPPPEMISEELVQELPVEPELPTATEADLQRRGPKPPEATALTREQKRFFRYDRNRDREISRNEMLSTRSSAFRKLDKDGNNLLTFEEWAHTTVSKFEGADVNRNGALTPQEFATTRPKPRAKPKPSCRC